MGNGAKVLKGLLSNAQDFDQRKVDYGVRVGDLWMFNYERDGYLKVTDNGLELFKGLLEKKPAYMNREVTGWAWGQLFNILGMPARYMKKMLFESPVLVSQHFNYWVRSEEFANKKLLLRSCWEPGPSDLGFLKLRAALSRRYTVLDDLDVLNALNEVAIGEYDFDLNCDMNDYMTSLRITMTDRCMRAGMVGSEPDYLRLGVDIDNSEVGGSSLRVIPVVYRQICSNGLRGWVQEGGGLVRKHIGLSTDNLCAELSEAIEDALYSSYLLSDKLWRTRAYTVDPEKMEEAMLNHGFSKKAIESVRDNYDVEGVKEGEASLYSFVNAITRTAKELNLERRMAFEEYAGQLLRNNVA